MSIPNKIICKVGAHYDGVYLLQNRTKAELIADLLTLYDIAVLQKAQSGKGEV